MSESPSEVPPTSSDTFLGRFEGKRQRVCLQELSKVEDPPNWTLLLISQTLVKYVRGSPMNPGLVLTADMCPSTPEELASMRSVPYLSALGSLQYLATMTRPDIQFAVNYLARFNLNPGQQHWLAVKHLFRYLKGTLDYKLTYAGPLQPGIFSTYCDASHGDCKDSGRSTGGYAIMGGRALC